MQQQSVQNGIDMRVSAIPLTPVRTRDRAPANGYISTPRSTSQHGNAARLAPKFEDIMDEQPDPSAMHHSSLPEDHLEDILALVHLVTKW